MLNVKPISTGQAGVDYMLRCCAGTEHAERVQVPAGERLHPGAEYLTKAVARGEPDGRWLGTGLAEFGLRSSQIATEDLVRQVFGQLQHPLTGERLGRAPYKYKTVEARLAERLATEPHASPERKLELAREVNDSQQQANGYYDLTFSAAKSISVYYAALLVAGRTEDAEKVWQAHRAGVAAALAYMEREAGFSRAGYHGRTKDGRSVGDYVDARHWIAVRFDHTTNREHQPQLHSHVNLLNKVMCEKDGVWRAVDGKALYAEQRGADAIYELTMEQAVMRDLPVQFTTREDGKAHEIVGITAEVRDAFSAGAARIQAQVSEWAQLYEERHGFAPSAYERAKATERAALATRPAKTAGPADLPAAWAANHDLTAPLRAAEQAERAELTLDRDAVIKAAVHRLQLERATWTRSDLMLKIKQQLDGRSPEDGPSPEILITGLADEALSPGSGYGLVLLTAPDVVTPPREVLRDSDGRSRFRPHRDERYCTEGQLSAEERLVATARAGGAPVLSDEALVIAEAELVARGLGDDQRAAVLGILGSGRRGDVLLGPAGAGKSYTTGALTHLWSQHHGPVLGLATSQNAANILREEGLSALNVAAFLAAYEPSERDGLAHQHLAPGALLIIDESGMSATEDLDRVRKVAEAAGAKMLWTGDHEQLDSVGAGGALRLLAADVTPFELTEVRRFTHEWEKEASLRLRAGDRDALADYDHHGRLFEGSAEQMRTAAYEGYLADILSGKRSLLLVPRNDQAAQLSAQVREKLVELGRVQADGTQLRDGTVAGVGDLIQTRMNAWSLTGVTGRAVANRDVWHVVGRSEAGVRVELEQDRTVTVTLPPEYVQADVTLAYATTSYAAQGRTVDTGHSLVDVSMTRGELYPNLTRGRDWNGAYVVTQAERDDEQGNEALRSNRVAVLSEVLDRDTAQHAALQVMREEIEGSHSLASMGTMWAKVVGEQARDRYSDVLVGALGAEQMDRLSRERGVNRLFRAVRDAELAGHDPQVALQAAVERGDLTDADSVSDVLRWRLTHATSDGRGQVQSWQDRTPIVDSEIGRYTRELAEAMDRRQADLGERAAEDLPEWALQHLGPVPVEPEERAEWVQRAGTVAGWRELSNVRGPSVLGPAPSREMPEQRAAWHGAYTALGAEEAGRDYAAASDDELRALVAQHERERAWAPAYVGDQLGRAERNTARYERQAVLRRAEAAAATDDAARERLERSAVAAETLAAHQAAQAARYEAIHEARSLWRDHTWANREAAEMSRRELDRREGVEVEPPAPENDLRGAGTTEADLDAAAARAATSRERIDAYNEAWDAESARREAELAELAERDQNVRESVGAASAAADQLVAQQEARRAASEESGQRLLNEEPQRVGADRSITERDDGGMER